MNNEQEERTRRTNKKAGTFKVSSCQASLLHGEKKMTQNVLLVTDRVETTLSRVALLCP